MKVTKENLKIKTVEETKTKGVYSFEPLPSGFGYTLANALRRVLMTSIKGAAVTQLKVKGANHQFTTVKGVKEDIVEITLNLKQLRIKMHDDNPMIATIKKKGAGEITAADIEISSDAEIMNKDLHIATLADSKSEVEMELTIESGTGYSPMEERETPKVGVIVLDALFSPIINVSYEVEPTRFGERTDLDKIILNVETDGSILPKDAIVEASELLKDYYEKFQIWDINDDAKPTVKVTHKTKKLEAISVEDLPLQTRTVNALRKHGIETLSEIAEKSDEELADIKNLGEKSLKEIKKLLEKEGLRQK